MDTVWDTIAFVQPIVSGCGNNTSLRGVYSPRVSEHSAPGGAVFHSQEPLPKVDNDCGMGLM